MLENIYYQIKKILKDLLFSVGNLLLTIVSYLLQISALIIIVLIAILIVNAALLIKIITLIKTKNEKHIYGEDTNVHSEIF
jgi:uncharacterized membrane protein